MKKFIDSAAGVTSALTEMLGIVVGKRYIVTRGSDDGTFEIGDHINVTADGSIICLEAQGWIDACDAVNAAKGMTVEIDHEWITMRKNQLRAELEALDA